MRIGTKYHGKETSSPEPVYEILSSILKSEDVIDREKEHFWVIGLNQKNKIKYIELVSLGTISESLVHPRETFRSAIRNGVTSLIIAHNHPSGEVAPSKQDDATTKKLVQAGKLLDIPIVDHIIITNKEFYSYSLTNRLQLY